MAAVAHPSRTTLTGREEGSPHVAGSLSGEDRGSGSLGLSGESVAAAGVVAALLLAASECWLGEVEEDALLHQEGTEADQEGQEANLGVVQGQHVVEIYLLGAGQVPVAAVGYPVPAFAAQHSDAAVEVGGAPWEHGRAAVLGI